MKLASLFSDHAVLQREISVPVWGWTRPLAPVTVTLGSFKAQSLSAADGRFLVRLPPMKAGGPYTLEVSSPGSGEKVIARDVWVGEVWLASGQSNMEFTFGTLRDANAAGAKTDIPGVRMANVAHVAHATRESEATLVWEVAGPKATNGFSAVAFYFAKELHAALGIAVGIVNSSWGGTYIEAWTSRETLIRNDDVAAVIARYEATSHSPYFWAQRDKPLEQSPLPADKGNEGLGQGWAKEGFDDSSWATMKIPGTWNSQGHRYSGILWFRKTIEVPQAWAGKDLVLNLGAADKQDITYFNGVQVGATGTGFEDVYWNKQRTYTIPGRLVKAGRSVIAVRVYSFIYDGGMIGPVSAMNLAPRGMEEMAVPLAGAWRYSVEQNFGVITPPPAIPGPGNANSPYTLFDSMIAPLIPYALRGAIWYQGESNAGAPQKYRRLMTEMIRDWRQVWGQGDFPFLMVQLANFNTTDNWPLLREAQLQSLCEPNTGMAVAIDIGDALDIHPTNKLDVGKRLAAWALTQTYGKDGVPSGPLYSAMVVEGDRIRLRFAHIGGGLRAREGALRSFIIAGENRKFVPAEAVIEGDTIVVSSPKVIAPVAVRYAWENNPEGCNLYNAAGLPASPFRTDTW